MTIRELEYFQAACREGSITKAAGLLYITPQGLSKTIKNLEFEFQTRLLHRTTSGITLTETGKYLYDHLPEVLDSYYRIYKNIQKIQQQQNHVIDLLSAYGILRLVTPDCITAFRKDHPEITLQYREYPDRQVERLFTAMEGNVAFTIGPSDLPGVQETLLESFEIPEGDRNYPGSGRGTALSGKQRILHSPSDQKPLPGSGLYSQYRI